MTSDAGTLRRRRFRRLAVILPAVAVLAAAGGILAADRLVAWRGKPVFTNPEELAPGRVALVPGTAPTLRDGRENLFFRYRIEAAARLYYDGRVRQLLLSGDNRFRNYNEPLAMKQALLARGVPETAITADFAGLRTFDSVVRAARIFGAAKLVIVSQRSHCERALCIARAHRIDAVGFAAATPAGAAALRVRLREALARVAVLLDLHLLHRSPRHLGKPERLNGSAEKETLFRSGNLTKTPPTAIFYAGDLNHCPATAQEYL